MPAKNPPEFSKSIWSPTAIVLLIVVIIITGFGVYILISNSDVIFNKNATNQESTAIVNINTSVNTNTSLVLREVTKKEYQDEISKMSKAKSTAYNVIINLESEQSEILNWADQTKEKAAGSASIIVAANNGIALLKPPAGFEKYHELELKALNMESGAMTTYIKGVNNSDLSKIEESRTIRKSQELLELLDQAEQEAKKVFDL